MSLDPRDSQRRTRSRSPGGREPRERSRVDEGRGERERSRVRAPSPPSSRYEDDRGYDYEESRERSTRKPAVVTAEPRGYGDSDRYRTSSPPDPYAIPGAFETPSKDKPKASYGDARGKEKDYYSEAGYGSRKDSYGRSEHEKSRYSPPEATYKYEDTREREKEYREREAKQREYMRREKEREEDEAEEKEYRRKEAEIKRLRQQKKDEEEKEQKERQTREKKLEEEKKERERSASFNISAGHSSFSGGIGYSHGHEQPSQYASPPGLAGYQIPPAGYAPPPAGHQGPYYPPDSAGYPIPPVGYPPNSSEPPRHPSLPAYAEPKQWEYAKPNENLTYGTGSYSSQPANPPTQAYAPPQGQSYAPPSSQPYGGHPSQPYAPPSSQSYAPPPAQVYATSASNSHHGGKQYHTEPARTHASSLGASNVVTVDPNSRNRRERDKSPAPGLGARMHSLSVSTGHHGSATMSLANAPGSPLLESYHGTYQSISPMPSPLMIANAPHSDHNVIDSISPLTSDDEDYRGSRKNRRTARFHDPAEEASILAKALRGDKHGPDTDPLVEILPGLTHEQVLELRVEYKKIVKTGSEKKGVNIAKHIKLRLKEEDPSLMKACYACALGKWESEAYWANFWYQGEKSRRELLIESLMGKTNREISNIKDGFSDKKYSDNIVKCMKMELKEDKFKKAVLMVLEEKKMEESKRIDMHLVEDDVKDLHRAVRAEKGGETTMIGIIVVRSDGHLKEVLKVYEATYRANFAREMLKKSGNLVGELLAHILNGVINKPVRDALLVHHALSLGKSDSIRTELLISRLVRYHWDRPHMEAVKMEYRKRYGVEMQTAVRDGTKNEWGRFCEMLCLKRVGDDVRRVERVEIHEYKR